MLTLAAFALGFILRGLIFSKRPENFTLDHIDHARSKEYK